MACEFDKASGVYEAIVADFPEEAEAYWGLVLCRYGIEYVDDPSSGKKVPTCHRSNFDSVMDDTNFEQALENADAVARKVYRDEAKQIEEIRKGIIEVSSKEDPYDIFICYKETDMNGDRTLDSVLAQDIYNALTEKGYRVFFSRITLEDKLGQEYEPYIFAALNSAKIMLAVGTDYEHYNAVWVKNEWSRFLHMISAGQKKILIPCYKNIDAYDIPKEFSKLQAQDLGKIGAMQDLLRGIEKIIGNAEPHKASEYTFAQPFFPNNNSALLKRGFMALEDGDWARANEFFEKALDQDAECGEAYFGLYLAENKLRSSAEFINSRLTRTQTSRQEELEACPPSQEIEGIVNAYLIPGYFEPIAIQKLFDFSRTYISCVKGRKLQLEKEIEFFKVNKNLIRAGQYAGEDFSVRFKQIQQDIFSKMKDRIAEAERDAEAQKNEVQQKYKCHIDTAKKKAKTDFEKFSQWREKDYQDVLGQYHRAETSGDFRALSLKFEAFKGYRESKKLAADCREKADKYAQKERQDAIIWREAEEKRLAAEKAEADRIRREEEKRQADKARVQERARTIKRIAVLCTIIFLAVTAYLVVFMVIPGQKYETAHKEIERGNYDSAISILQSISFYQDSAERVKEIQYKLAEKALADGKGYEAAIYFGQANTYKDANKRSRELWEDLGVYKTIATDEVYIFAVKNDGSVMANCRWPNEDDEQLQVENWTNIVSIAAGSSVVAGIQENGTVKVASFAKHDCTTWENMLTIDFGGYGITAGLRIDGTVAISTNSDDLKKTVSSWKNVISVDVGAEHVVALCADGTVLAAGTGRSDYGQCDVQGWSNVVAISAGSLHTVGVLEDGTVVATGRNDENQCEVNTISNAVSVATEYGKTFCVLADGSVYVAEDNDWFSPKLRELHWRDIVSVAIFDTTLVGLKNDGTIVVEADWYPPFDVSAMKDIKTP